MNAAPALSMLIVALLLGAALGGLAVWAWAPPRRRLSPLPTEWTLAARRVLNSNERRVYNQLRLAFPKYIVLPKLPLVRLCQPATPDQVKFWYELIGAAHVTFAVCNPNGHVVLVIDLDSTRNHSRRSTRIKESVLEACGIQRLHCAVDELPSIEELRSLIQDISAHALTAASASEPVSNALGEALGSPALSLSAASLIAAAVVRPLETAVAPVDRLAAPHPSDPPAARHDQNLFLDSFFASDERSASAPDNESQPDLPDCPPHPLQARAARPRAPSRATKRPMQGGGVHPCALQVVVDRSNTIEGCPKSLPLSPLHPPRSLD